MILEPTDPMPDRLTCTLVFALAWFVSISSADAGEGLTFEKDVRRIFKAFCLDCRQQRRVTEKASLTYASAFRCRRRQRRSAVVMPSQARPSLIVERLKNGEDAARREEGAPGTDRSDRAVDRRAGHGRSKGARHVIGIDLTPEERHCWAFQPVRRPAA